MALPAVAAAAVAGALGLTTPAGIGTAVAAAVYLLLDLALLQPRLENRSGGHTSGENAAPHFLQKALEARDISEVAADFADAVAGALGPSTRAVLVAPSPDGDIRILAGGEEEEPPEEMGDVTGAFLFLGEGVAPIYRSQLETSMGEGSEEARRLMDLLSAEVMLPLRHRGLLLGLGLVGAPTQPGMTRLDNFYRAMRAHTTVAIANTYLDAEARDSRRLGHTFDLATAVQESLMPSERPVRRPGYTLRGVFRPVAECGGDLWTWRELTDDRVLLVIADATGHGAAPALLAAVAKGTIDAHWLLKGGDLDPGQLLSALNRAVFRAGRRRYLMTAFAAVADLSAGRLTFANAGQNFPYVMGQKGLEPLVARGDALGSAPETTYETRGRNLDVGDRVVLYTDGFIEAGAPYREPFGEKRFRTAIAGLQHQPAVRLPDLLTARVEEYLEGAIIADDMTCLAFEVTGGFEMP